ncbi:3-oxoacyl-(acyl carrier protein) synthase III [Campylobacter lari]|uniref:3-oxoacyl-[acp] synthase III n=2 Tax=Campylobacter TaxID=194 RepID=A0A0A8HZW4_CAMLA|nr:3-oxoacyl-(acyl carrier protein) synthase III [Campylobacter lari]AJD02355.1 3-oxoacyl-[acp] synthase III [Campylobacter lari NCTC 11845]EAK9954230.1 3-oxoacyl-(acyl carrier protein) synthase III [Campylobacter lari]
MKASFSHAKISAMTMIVPQNKYNIDDELHTRYQGDVKKLNRIKKSVGLQYRYAADQDTSVSDLAEYGANILFNEYGLDKNTIDAIVVITQTPDFFIPATACYLHGRLDLPQTTLAFDINQSCAGFVYGLYTLFSMIENGGCKRILMVCGDTSSRGGNKTIREKNKHKTIIGGDGLSVSLLEYTQEKTQSFFELGSDGKGLKYLFIPFGAYKTPKPHEFDEPEWYENEPKEAYMNGLEIFNFATQKEPEAFESILEYAKCKKEDLDYIFLHQANKSIVDTIIKKLKLDPLKAPNDTITKYGNVNGATIPATICDTLNTIANPLSKKLKVELGGFGAGLGWANAILELDQNFWCKQTQIYKKDL